MPLPAVPPVVMVKRLAHGEIEDGGTKDEESKSPTPLPPAPNRPEASAQRGPLSALVGKRVVIVEDEGITLLQLRRTLTRAGLNVVATAGNGREGVEAVLRERPDLVLMDIKMPLMDGIEAARRILESYPVCIIMLTAFSTVDFQQQAKEVGACGYILKPITSTILLPQMEAAYRKRLESEGQNL